MDGRSANRDGECDCDEVDDAYSLVCPLRVAGHSECLVSRPRRVVDGGGAADGGDGRSEGFMVCA